MLGAEKAYAKLEQKLQRYLDTYEATHNYDEYHFYLDEIEHDPYVLISILSALHDGVFTLAEVQGELEMLFEKQYILTETVTMQIRYRTKMMVIIGPYGVPQVITYQEPYEYYICTVKLKNKDLSHLPVEVLTEEQLSAYSLYMRTLGNRPDLFGKAQYPNASTIKQPTYYDIPPEALKDDRFAAMMEEATKYIGYPYVWGGSSPSTSCFDGAGQTGRPCVFQGNLRYPRREPLRYLCRQFHHAALRRPYLLHKPQLKILAGTFLQLWAFTVTPERILYGKKTFPH